MYDNLLGVAQVVLGVTTVGVALYWTVRQRQVIRGFCLSWVALAAGYCVVFLRLRHAHTLGELPADMVSTTEPSHLGFCILLTGVYALCLNILAWPIGHLVYLIRNRRRGW